MRIEARLGDESWSWKAQVQDARETSVPAGPVDDIDLILFDTSQTEVLRLPLEFCFLNRADELGHIDELEVLLRKGAKPGTEAVYDEIMRAYFAPSDEVDADSYTTQRDHWRERAWAKAIEATEGDAAAHATELEQAASALRLRQRASETIIARINDEGVKIEVLKNTGSREATSRQTGEKRRNDDPAYRALVREERVLLDVSESLAEALQASGTTAGQLTATSGTTATAVEDALGAGGSVTLRELTKIGRAVGLVPTLRTAPEPAERRGRGCGQGGRRQRRARACIYPSFDLRFDRAARKRRGTDDVPREGGCRRDNRGRTAEEPDSPRGGHVLALRDGFPRYGARGAGTVPAPPAKGRFPITTPAA